MQDADVLCFKAQIFGKVLGEPAERGNALREDNGAHIRARPDADVFQVSGEFLILGGGLLEGLLSQLLEGLESLMLFVLGRKLGLTDLLEAILD